MINNIQILLDNKHYHYNHIENTKQKQKIIHVAKQIHKKDHWMIVKKLKNSTQIFSN